MGADPDDRWETIALFVLGVAFLVVLFFLWDARAFW